MAYTSQFMKPRTGQDARAKAAEVDTKLEAVMKRLAFALSSREAADAIKELVETMMGRR